MSDKSIWCFYTIQNDKGEEAAHPNAFKVKFSTAQATLRDVRASFPLKDTGSFHFRFQVDAPDSGESRGPYVFLDTTRDDDVVPLTGPHAQARILRLGESLPHPSHGTAMRCAQTT
jgi:hypothetical protein